MSDPNVVKKEDRRGTVTVAATYNPSLAAGLALTKPRSAESAKLIPQAEVISDEVLFARAAGGENEALGELIARYEKTLFSLLLRMTGDRHLSDDLFQDTFLHAMRAYSSFNRKMRFKPWVTAIAVNLVRDDARKRKVRSEVELNRQGDENTTVIEPVSTGENPDEAAQRKDSEVYVRQALTQLTALEREVVLLHFYNGMTLEDTASILGAPVGTIKSRLHGALQRLWGILELSEL